MYTTDIYILVFIQKEHLMHLNSKTGKEGEEQGTKKAKRGGSEDEDELGKPSKKINFLVPHLSLLLLYVWMVVIPDTLGHGFSLYVLCVLYVLCAHSNL